ncbi:MAG: flagellar hook-basal body complex protein FliE [candidate division Zixibacteria bacterium]|nr:flagellar hook-basal body complex protein FliE [candidate division Zixibacteria bacterium]
MTANINGIGRLVPGLLEQIGRDQKGSIQTDTKPDSSFTELLTNLVSDVNSLHNESAQIQEAFMTGEPVELHQVMIQAEKAGLATDLLLEIRNRLLSAYTDLAKMPL